MSCNASVLFFHALCFLCLILSVSSGWARGFDRWSNLPTNCFSGQTPCQHTQSQGVPFWQGFSWAELLSLILWIWCNISFLVQLTGDGHSVEEGGGESRGAGTWLSQCLTTTWTNTHLQTWSEHLQGTGYKHTQIESETEGEREKMLRYFECIDSHCNTSYRW